MWAGASYMNQSFVIFLCTPCRVPQDVVHSFFKMWPKERFLNIWILEMNPKPRDSISLWGQ